MSEINRLEWEAYIRDSELIRTIRRIEGEVGDLANHVRNRGRDMEDVFSRLAKVAGGFLSLNAAEGFIRKLIQVRSEFQQLEIAFTTMLGSKERADKLTQDLIEFAGTTPFGMKDTANAAKQLLAYGSTAENVKNELRMLGDVAAGTSQPIGDLVYLYGTLRTQGRAYLMDIRQFAGRGIPIYEELAKVLNVNKNQVNDLVSAGKVGFAEVQQAFQNMTAAGSMFGGLMEAQSRTIQGELERLGDAFDQMLNKIGKDTEGVISDVIQAASVLVENYEIVLNTITGLIAVYGAYRAALIATAALQQLNAARAVGMTAAEMLHYGAIVLKTKAMTILNAVMLANPAILMTASIIALSSAIYALTQVTNATSAAQEKMAVAQQAGIDKSNQEKRSVQQLVDVIKDNTASVEQRKAAYDKLQAQTKGVLASFTQEEIAIGKASDALNQYIINVGRAASARKAFDEFNTLAEQLDVINRKGIEGIGIWERAGRGIQNLFGANGAEAAKLAWGFGDKRGEDLIVDQQKAVIKKQMDVLQKEFGNEFKSFISGVEQTVKGTPGVDLLSSPLNNYNAILKSAKSKADLDALKKALTERMEALAPGDKDIAKYKSKLQELAEIEKQYSIGNPTAAANTEFQAAERYKSMMDDISRARESYLRTQMSRDQQEVESVRDKYRTIRAEIDKFNRDPKNKTKIDKSPLDAIEQQEIKETNIKIDTRYLLEGLSQQKAIFEQFEQTKKEIGEEKARERFQNELDLSKTYGQLIEEAMYSLLEIDPTQMSAAQKERLAELTKLQIDWEKSENARQLNKYVEAVNQAKTFDDKMLSIEKDFQEKIKLIGKNASAEQIKVLEHERDEKKRIETESYFERSVIGRKAAREAIVYTRAEIKGRIKALKEALSEMDLSASLRSRLEHELSTMQVNLNIGSVKSNIDYLSKLRQDISNGISEYMTKGGLSNLNDETLAANPKLKELVDRLRDVNAMLVKLKMETEDGSGVLGFLKKLEGDETLRKIAEWGQIAAQSFAEMAQALGGVNTQAGYLLGNIGELAGRAADVAVSIYSGDPKAIVKSVVGAVGSLVSIGKRVKEMNRQAREENQKFYDAAKRGELEYQALLRQRELETSKRGKSSYRAIVDELEALKKQSPEIEKAYNSIFNSLQGQEFIDGKGYKHGTWFRKAKTWDIMASLAGSDYARLEKLYTEGRLKDQAKADFEALKALKEELEDLGLSMEDLKKNLNELLTGTNASSLASGLTDLFAEGKRSAADFGKSFEEILTNSIKATFQAKYLTDAMAPFYEELARMMDSGNLTENQIAELKKKYIALGEEYAKKWEDIEKVTGTKTPNSSSGLQGAIQREMTEATGSLLTGIYQADYEQSKIMSAEMKGHTVILNKHLMVANSSLTALNAIQFNTGETVKELKTAVGELQEINKNLGSNKGRTAEGMGL
ncbi:tape measure protein [Sphingobacterium thalpophilum]|uniref:tape measure protein n=1 Tax=Sphingobacterium thalpophilum TaxID=259 RepID=UPI003D968450